MGQPSPSGCARPLWFVVLFNFVLVVSRCSRSIKVVANLSHVVSGWQCLFWFV